MKQMSKQLLDCWIKDAKSQDELSSCLPCLGPRKDGVQLTSCVQPKVIISIQQRSQRLSLLGLHSLREVVT